MKRTIFLLSTSFFFACGEPIEPPLTPIEVNIDINGNTGDAIDDGFFGFASVVDQPATINEDQNGDGNLDQFEDLDFDDNLDVAEDANNNGILDPGEDIDGDGNLDVNEDADGDGVLDFVNEDINDDGLLDTALLIDLNQDGEINDQDHNTRAILGWVASTGETTCESIVTSLQGNDEVPFEGTVLLMQGFQIGIGPGIPVAFGQGTSASTSLNDPQNIISIEPVFGVFTNGVPSLDSIAEGVGLNSTIEISTIGDTLTATASGDVTNNGDTFVYDTTVNGLPECEELSDTLASLLERGLLLQ
jgi:hypothetical protein